MFIGLLVNLPTTWHKQSDSTIRPTPKINWIKSHFHHITIVIVIVLSV